MMDEKGERAEEESRWREKERTCGVVKKSLEPGRSG